MNSRSESAHPGSRSPGLQPLIMNAPVKDISADEKETLTDYLKNGGRMLLLAGCTQDTLSNLTDFISQYGMDLKNGFVADPAPQHYYNNNPLT